MTIQNANGSARESNIYDIVSERWNKFMTDVNAGYWRGIEMGGGGGGA